MFPFLSLEWSLVETAFELEENVSEKGNTAQKNPAVLKTTVSDTDGSTCRNSRENLTRGFHLR
jgi:hypothetical protein